jgi:hypothetical protein
MISWYRSASWTLTALVALLLLGQLANPQEKSARFEKTERKKDQERKATAEDLKKLEDLVLVPLQR